MRTKVVWAVSYNFFFKKWRRWLIPCATTYHTIRKFLYLYKNSTYSTRTNGIYHCQCRYYIHLCMGFVHCHYTHDTSLHDIRDRHKHYRFCHLWSCCPFLDEIKNSWLESEYSGKLNSSLRNRENDFSHRFSIKLLKKRYIWFLDSKTRHFVLCFTKLQINSKLNSSLFSKNHFVTSIVWKKTSVRRISNNYEKGHCRVR